jgi:hypothetical protein
MREETQQTDTMKILADSLTHATGAPFVEAVQTLRWLHAYVCRCLDAGLSGEFLVAMERSGLGHLAESLLEASRPRYSTR